MTLPPSPPISGTPILAPQTSGTGADPVAVSLEAQPEAQLEAQPEETLLEAQLTRSRPERPSSWRGYPATYALIGLNVAVFALMSCFGPLLLLWQQRAFGLVLTAPFDDRVLWFFGSSASHSILTQGQWWRLITANFVHVTPLHLLLNMWCLWNLGLFGEPLLGPAGLIAVYLLTGVAGMLQSLAFSVIRGTDTLVAGASGAIFGLAGILIVLLSNRKLALPWAELRSLRQQVIFFALANLALGVAPDLLPSLSPDHLRSLHLDPASLPRIDNNAHVGGFLTGLALGVPLFPRMTSGRSSYRSRQALVFGMGALFLCLLARAIASLAQSLSSR